MSGKPSINGISPAAARASRKWLSCAAVLMLVAPATEAQSLPPDTQPLTAYQVYAMVRDKSWQWDNGAGRFLDAGRQFLAWADGKDGPTYARGRYVITKTGKLCLVAEWYGRQGISHDSTCFENRQAGGVIYQRRARSQDWYIFSHTPPQPADEYSKFVSDDLVSNRFSEIEAGMHSTGATQKGGNQ